MGEFSNMPAAAKRFSPVSAAAKRSGEFSHWYSHFLTELPGGGVPMHKKRAASLPALESRRSPSPEANVSQNASPPGCNKILKKCLDKPKQRGCFGLSRHASTKNASTNQSNEVAQVHVTDGLVIQDTVQPIEKKMFVPKRKDHPEVVTEKAERLMGILNKERYERERREAAAKAAEKSNYAKFDSIYQNRDQKKVKQAPDIIVNTSLLVTVHLIDDFADDAGLKDRTDPFVSLQLGEELYRTAIKDNAGGKCVVFDETFTFHKIMQQPDNTLKVRVLDSDKLCDDLLGECQVNLDLENLPGDAGQPVAFQTMAGVSDLDPEGKITGKVVGKVVMSFVLEKTTMTRPGELLKRPKSDAKKKEWHAKEVKESHIMLLRLTNADLELLASFERAPRSVEMVMTAVCELLKLPYGSWSEVRRLLYPECNKELVPSHQQFKEKLVDCSSHKSWRSPEEKAAAYPQPTKHQKMPRIVEYVTAYSDQGASPGDMLNMLKKYTSDPEFAPEKVGEYSKAAFALCAWVRAVELHFKEVKRKPTREVLEFAIDSGSSKLNPCKFHRIEEWLPMIASESTKTLGSKTYDDLLHSNSPLVRKMFRPPPPKEFAHFQEAQDPCAREGFIRDVDITASYSHFKSEIQERMKSTEALAAQKKTSLRALCKFEHRAFGNSAAKVQSWERFSDLDRDEVRFEDGAPRPLTVERRAKRAEELNQIYSSDVLMRKMVTAIEMNDQEAVRSLAHAGADFEWKDDKGRTFFEIAKEYKQLACLKALQSCKKHLQQARTDAHITCESKSKAVVLPPIALPTRCRTHQGQRRQPIKVVTYRKSVIVVQHKYKLEDPDEYVESDKEEEEEEEFDYDEQLRVNTLRYMQEFQPPLVWRAGKQIIRILTRKTDWNLIQKKCFQGWFAFMRLCKEHIGVLMDQYTIACAHHHSLPVGLPALKRFIKNRTSSTLNFSGSRLTKTAMSIIMEALTVSRGCEYLPPGAIDLNLMRRNLGHECVSILDVSCNDLQEGGCSILVDVLVLPTCIWRLTTLKIDSNNIRDSGCIALVCLLSSTRVVLQHLSITNNSIGDKGLAALFDSLVDNKCLLSLDLANNRAENHAGTAIGKMLKWNRTLTSLDCRSNLMRGSGAQSLFEGLCENDDLLHLNVSWNGLGDEGPCGALALAIASSSLNTLDVSYSRISLFGATLIAQELEKSSIAFINMDGNALGKPGIRLLMKALQKIGLDKENLPEISLKKCDKMGKTKMLYDPDDPAGDYELDMSDGLQRGILITLLRLHALGRGFFVALDEDRAINMDALKLQEKPPPNALLNGQRYTISLPSFEDKDEDGNPCRVVNPDEREWPIPRQGTLAFTFASMKLRNPAEDSLHETSMQHLQEAFENRSFSHDQRVEVMDMYIRTETVLSFEQLTLLVKYLQWSMQSGGQDLCQSRGVLVAKCYHKLTDSAKAHDSLDLLDADARGIAETILGVASLTFTRHNPTGHYRLRLHDQTEREICLRLIECRGEQSKRLSQIEAYYKNRTSKRDMIERVWRNCKFNNAKMDFDMSWKMPEKGVIEFDFVSLKKPGPECTPLRDAEFFDYCKLNLSDLLASSKDLTKGLCEAKYVAAVRRWSETVVFTCTQLRRLLRRVETPLARVEMVVIGFCRTVDWHQFKFIQHELSVSEFKELRHRIGPVNMWDESVACDYYELDLTDPEQRWVCQELVHLGVIEPGFNMPECALDNVPYTIPSAWITDVPRKGLVQVYYNREARVIRKIREQGAWDHTKSIFFKDGSVINNDSVTFPDSSFVYGDSSFFMPTWMLKHAQDGEGLLHEPPGLGWVREHKLRRIVNKFKEKFRSPQEAMKKLDRDGGGDLDRREMIRGLFEMGIWLHPDESKALFEELDQDGGGSVDAKEFIAYWDKFGFNYWEDDTASIRFDFL